MKIDKQYLKKYYHRAAVDQLCAQYNKRGYKVTVEERIGDYRVDMVARKDDSIIFFEVKTGDVRAETKARIKQQASYLKETYPGCKFFLIAVRYPDEDTIVIDNIEELVYDYLVSSGIPSDLDELSTHTSIEDVESVSVNSIDITNESILIECEGRVGVQLDYDNRESDASFYMSFPFTMKGELEYNDGKLEMVDMTEFEADTSEFYE